MYTIHPIVARAWPGGRVRARAKVSFVSKIPLLARRTRPKGRPSATIGYLVYTGIFHTRFGSDRRIEAILAVRAALNLKER